MVDTEADDAICGNRVPRQCMHDCSVDHVRHRGAGNAHLQRIRRLTRSIRTFHGRVRRARNVLHITPISLTNEERPVLSNHEVGVCLAGRIQLGAAKNEAVEIRVTARLVEVERGLEGVVTGSVIAGVPEGSSRTAFT
jgi:hypothetical protein